MELRHLRYFIAVAEALSFTKAAQNLRLAQPSLTRQVRNLEEEIGAKLFDRSNNRVVLTAEGRRFLFDAKKILVLCAESVAAVQAMTPGDVSQLNIGYVTNVHLATLPATLAAFRKLFPNVALNLFDMNSAEQLRALDSRKIDLGFVGFPPPSSDEGLSSATVAKIPVLAALPHAHRLAKKAKLSLTDLAEEFFIGMSPTTHPGARAWVVDICERAGFTAKVLQEADSEANAIKFVSDGLGVALLSDQFLGLQHEGVDFCPLVPPLLFASTIAWRHDNPSTPLKEYVRIVKDFSGGGLRGRTGR